MRWRYSVAWSLPHRPCPGLQELAAAEVQAGCACPPEILAHWRPGSGYAVTLDFVDQSPVRRWSKATKASVRRRRLQARLQRRVPLFADELFAREIARRARYFEGDDLHGESSDGD